MRAYVSAGIVITGASGHLGRLTVEQLLNIGVPSDQIVATGRDETRLDELGRRCGVQVRRADLADPVTMAAGFAGADKVLLVSTTTVGERFDNHRRAIDAARDAAVSLIAYTSSLNASSAKMRLAEEHLRTEDYLRASGVRLIILRNGWYLENYTDQIPMISQHRVLLGSSQDGRVSAASRMDYAAAAAAVLTQDGHAGSTYELGGDAFTLTELAETISEVLGSDVVYKDLTVDEYADALIAAGLPADLAAVIADADAGLARGELYTEHTDLASLIGRPATTRRQAVTDAVKQLEMTTA